MSFISEWCVPKRVVYIRYGEEVTIEDFQGVAKAMTTYIEEGDPPLVHNIVDYTDVKQMPTSVFKGAKALSHLGNPKYGWAIIIDAGNPLVKMRTSIMAQGNNNRFRSFETLQEGIEFLQYVDSTLEDVAWDFPEAQPE